MKNKIPLSLPHLGQEEIKAVTKVLKSGWLTSGPMVKQFETEFARYLNIDFAIAMNSCTSALIAAIQTQGIRGEVILPSFTFVASANAVVLAGAKPVFADIDYTTCNIDPQSISDLISPQTEAVMVVHYAGQSCQMQPIQEICEKHGLFLIEDSAHTLGGEYQGQKTGTFGIGCFSFFPTKNITTGEGGMLTTRDQVLAEKVRSLIGHGITKNTYQREVDAFPWIRLAQSVGYNFRMSDILAAVGCTQLNNLDNFNTARRKHASYLMGALSSIEELSLPVEQIDCKHVYQMFTIKLHRTLNRDRFVHKLRENGVEASVHYSPPVHMQPPYLNQKVTLPITDVVSQSIVTLPFFPTITTGQLDYVVKCIKDIIHDMSQE